MLEKPNDVEAEREILAACFTGGGPSFDSEEVMKLAIGTLAPEHFEHPHFKKIYVAMVEAVKDGGGKVDWGDVRGNIDAKSAARDTLRDIVTNSNLPPVTKPFCNRLIGKLQNAYRGRKLASLGKGILTDALAGNSEIAYNLLADGLIELTRDRFDDGAQYIEAYVPGVMKEIEDRRKAEGGVVGYRTGIAPIDYVWKGLQKKNLYFLGARPGHGKSMALGQSFYNLSKSYPDANILLATTEMDAKQYLTRIACSVVGLDYDDYTGGNFSEDMENLLKACIKDMEHNNIVINEDGAQDTNSLRQDIIRFQPDILLVDYAQEFYPAKPKYNEYADTTMFIRELNAMKKTFNLSIFAAIQLSRAVENRPPDERRPIASDARATGWIEQAADGIFMLYRPKEYAVSKVEYGNHTEYYNSKGEIIDSTLLEWVCAKNRHGKKRDVNTYVKDGSMFIQNEPIAA